MTNDGARSPETAARFYQRVGLEIDADHVLTSGSLIGSVLDEIGGHSKLLSCLVLGTSDTIAMFDLSGHIRVETSDFANIDAVMFCDDSGYDVMATLNATLSAVNRAY